MLHFSIPVYPHANGLPPSQDTESAADDARH